ncbi:imidazolonepropionase [Bacteroidota bacterium]
MGKAKLIGPIKQLIPLDGLSLTGPLTDDQLNIIPDAGVMVNSELVLKIGDYNSLCKSYPDIIKEEIYEEAVILPGFVDSHTHICYGGNRSGDYALRISGENYQKILSSGGGIYDTVQKTRAASSNDLEESLLQRVSRHINEGVTTIEVKSGYGLSVDEEIKMLEAIQSVNQETLADLIPTCLAAHVCPPEYNSAKEFLDYISSELLPIIIEKKLSNRIDIFVENNVFPVELSKEYLLFAKNLGFDITVHADQFTTGGSLVAAEVGACSADHLEASKEKEITLLVDCKVVCVVLPGASMGLGMHFGRARKILDTGGILGIATDWNPGSAPMGDLLMQAAVLSAAEKLSTAETFSAITFRAAHALNLNDRGRLIPGNKADFIGFPISDFREILYNQGKLKPEWIWKNGKKLINQ